MLYETDFWNMIKEKAGEDHYSMQMKKKNWKDALKKYKLESSLKWEIAIVKKIGKFSINIETENNKLGIIRYENINWTKKDFDKILKVNDVIYVKKIMIINIAYNNYPM